MKPSPSEFHDPDFRLPPACAEARESIQNVLDGDARPGSDGVRLHREQCSECREYANAAQRLLSGIPRLHKKSPSPTFADRVMVQLHAQPARPWFKRRLYWAGFALAASVLIAVLLIQRDPQTVHESNVAVAVVAPPKVELPEEKQHPLRDSLHDASSAVSALTRKATNDGFGLKMPKWPMPRVHVDPPKSEAAFASLNDVRHNAAMSIAPMADSARRAFDVFWRELGPDLDPKPNP